MVLQRIITKEGRRRFLPWTWWSDMKWRTLEPEGGLPFYKPQRARLNRIMIRVIAFEILVA